MPCGGAELFPSMDLMRKVLRGVCGEPRSHVLAWLCSPVHACMCVHKHVCAHAYYLQVPCD